jgi:hypothetical protein
MFLDDRDEPNHRRSNPRRVRDIGSLGERKPIVFAGVRQLVDPRVHLVTCTSAGRASDAIVATTSSPNLVT